METSPQSSFWHVAPQWLSGIGTVAAMGYVLLKDGLRAWRNKPRLKLTVSTDEPFRIVSDGDSDNAASARTVSKTINIWARVSNNNRTAARECQVYCERFFVLDASGQYSSDGHVFQARRFIWSSGKKEATIHKSIPAYFRILSIRKSGAGPENEAKEDEPERNANQHVAWLCLDDDSILEQHTEIELKAHEKSIVLKVHLCSPEIKPIEKFILISINSLEDSLIAQRNNLSIQEMPRKEFLSKVIKGERV